MIRKLITKVSNWFKNRGWMDWDTYMNKMEFIDNFYFQQETRKQSLKNSKEL